MQIYRIEKKDKICYVTPMQFIEYERKGRIITKKLKSKPFRKDTGGQHKSKTKKDIDE